MLSYYIRKRISEPDKILHIKYSAVIMLVSYMLLPMMLALIFTFLVGLLKECWDHYYGTGFCLHDMLANIVGILCSLCLLKITPLIL
jgi:hypothetical protein